MERKTITTFLLLVQLTCGVFSWGRPVWCPAGRFFNITSFKCQDCKTCSGVLKFISRPCSGIHDTRCSSFFFGANWMFKTINNSCTKQTIDPSLKVELSIETKQQVPIVSEKRASIDEEPNDEVEIEIWLPAACVVAAVFLLAAISCFAFERYSEKQKRRKRHGTLPHLEAHLTNRTRDDYVEMRYVAFPTNAKGSDVIQARDSRPERPESFTLSETI